MFIQIILSMVLNSPPTNAGAMAPNLYSDGDTAWLTWVEPIDQDKHIQELKCVSFKDETWGTPHTILKASNLFVNWADFPELCVAQDGTMFVTWLHKSGPGSYSYDIGIARSDDEGKSWSMLGNLNDDRVLGEHGFVSLVPDGEDSVRAFWLDGRAMTGDGHSGEGGGDMQLRTALVNTQVHESILLDERVCECCGTDATILDGKPVAVYRDRLENETRDISIATKAGYLKTINEDNWKIEGCPVNGPSVDAIGSTMVAAWFTSPDMKSALKLIFIENGKSTNPILLSTKTIGRVDVALVDKDHAIACWLETCSTGMFVVTSKVSKDGLVEPFNRIQKVASSRQAGFPRIALVGKDLLIVWTAQDRDKGIQSNLLKLIEK